MKIHIEESPYGDKGVTYDNNLGMIKHFILQLKSFRVLKKSPKQMQHLEDDIKGYELILESKSEKNVSEFLKLKHSMPGLNLITNIERINYMKENGLWEIVN